MKWLPPLLLSMLLVLVFPATARAHEPIFSLKYVDGENIIIASYNVHEFTAAQPVTFNLRVYTIAGVPVVYKSVEAIVEQRGKTVFNQTMAASSYNDVNWVYTFPEEGAFDVRLHFTNDDAAVATANFPIDVANVLTGGAAPSDRSLTSQIFAWPTGAAFVLGIGLTLLVLWRRQRPGGEPAEAPGAVADDAVEAPVMTDVS
jgi:hypothetical protein